MNSKFIATAVVTLAALSSASAFAASSSNYAEPAEFAYNPATVSSLTRAQVQTEYLQARKDGTLVLGQEFDVNPSKGFGTTVTRAQVKAEVLATGAIQPNVYSNFM